VGDCISRMAAAGITVIWRNSQTSHRRGFRSKYDWSHLRPNRRPGGILLFGEKMASAAVNALSSRNAMACVGIQHYLPLMVIETVMVR
jgi:hypothetical protein